MLPSDYDGVCIIGKRKQGKSTLLEQLLAGEPRVQLYDAKGALREPIVIKRGVLPSMPKYGVHRSYVPAEGQPFDECEWSAFLAIQLGRCISVVDELPDALEGQEPGASFAWVTRMGRMRAIRFIYSFQRAFEVPRMVTANASDWFLFQTNEPRDLQYIAQSVSADAAIRVRNLKRGQAVHVRDGNVFAIMETYRP